ncbi:LexA regulated protein [Escherichia coli]|uniref:LexA regulated protein n=1 Tax=Escherichia coli TaxID=562 RepID=A0A8S0FYX0_ECOLX|nr:LexA regulated protein [Escherichia coli]
MYYGALSIRAEAWLIVSPEVTKIMAKEQTDRTTLDLFAHERRPGRPKTNPLSRDEQHSTASALRINKRNQLKRDKVRGLKRVELKLNAEAVEALNELAESRNMSRSELIEEMLMQQLAALRSQGIV